MRTCQSVVIDRPCAEVFAFVTDLRNELRWQPEIVAVTLDGPLRVGGHFHETRVTFGRRFEWEFRITELEAPRRIAPCVGLSREGASWRHSAAVASVDG